MTWLKVDYRTGSHPATLRAGNAAMGMWLQLACWLATFPKEGDRVPASIAKRYGTKRELRRLLEVGLLVEGDDCYHLRRGMNIAGSNLPNSFWAIQRKDGRAAIPERVRLAVYERDGYMCVECFNADDLSLDHIYPWSLGGDDSFDNLRTLCRSCNSKKGARV